MSQPQYTSFDVFVDRTATGYRARALDPDASGTAQQTFQLPDLAPQLAHLADEVARGRSRALVPDTVESAARPTDALARQIGGLLWESVFNGDLRAQYRSQKEAAETAGRRLRLRLHLADVPELGRLPWEYLYIANLDRFVAMESPVVRYLDLPERVRSVATRPPLRVLVVAARPKDLPGLDTEHEWLNLSRALASLVTAGQVVVTRLVPQAGQPTLAALREALEDGAYHVLHFMGHGDYDEALGQGLVVLERADGNAEAVTADSLGELLQGHPPMRLVVLNACEGARGADTDPWASAAASLVQKGVPAVIAMQFPILDRAAIGLSAAFYRALARGKAVDTALTEARRAARTDGTPLEWGTPVLYMRAGDGRILDRGAGGPLTLWRAAVAERPGAWAIGVSLVLLVALGLAATGIGAWRLGPAPPPTPPAVTALAASTLTIQLHDVVLDRSGAVLASRRFEGAGTVPGPADLAAAGQWLVDQIDDAKGLPGPPITVHVRVPADIARDEITIAATPPGDLDVSYVAYSPTPLPVAPDPGQPPGMQPPVVPLPPEVDKLRVPAVSAALDRAALAALGRDFHIELARAGYLAQTLPVTWGEPLERDVVLAPRAIRVGVEEFIGSETLATELADQLAQDPRFEVVPPDLLAALREDLARNAEMLHNNPAMQVALRQELGIDVIVSGSLR